MRGTGILIAGLLCLLATGWARAGLYNTAEPAIPLDEGVERFLVRLAGLRNYVVNNSAAREDYLAKVQQLRAKQAKQRLSAEELANLGAYLIRLQTTDRFRFHDWQEANEVLESGAAQYPRDFHLLANLAMLHYLMGNLDLVPRVADQAITVAPDAESRRVEEYFRRLVELRAPERPNPEPPLDRLFGGVRFVGDSGEWEIGRIAAAEKAKLPDGSVAAAKRIVQHLLIASPSDGRLHWLLGELANADNDVRGAKAAFDAAVSNFNLSTPELKLHRQRLIVALEPKEAPAVPVVPPDIFGDAPAAPPGSAWNEMNWKGWLVVGAGAAIILLFLVLQVREMIRRRKRPQAAGKRA